MDRGVASVVEAGAEFLEPESGETRPRRARLVRIVGREPSDGLELDELESESWLEEAVEGGAGDEDKEETVTTDEEADRQAGKDTDAVRGGRAEERRGIMGSGAPAEFELREKRDSRADAMECELTVIVAII